MSAISVKLEVFEGPLDLLLHLIEKNEVDIYDIPIVLITDQYLDYIKQMDTRDMNIMSDFLLTAATLLDIKCRMLLPKEINEEGEEEDPRAELVEKLIEYKLYKYLSYELKDCQIDAVKTMFKKPTMPAEVEEYEQPIDYRALVGDMDLTRLNIIFKSMMKKQTDKIDPIRSRFGKIEKDEVNLEEKTAYIEEYIREHKEFSFRELLGEQNTKMELVVTFLVILELMKTGEIVIVQQELFDDIMITSRIAA
ncbi:MAG: segregation/condensation protein A [Lachnospiraceae bacterium]|nr:segregation/condensation protein A [Lachnospiraceae bacterium]